MTWTRVVRSALEQHHSSKESMGDGVVCDWWLEGQSLVRLTAERFGFVKEVA